MDTGSVLDQSRGERKKSSEEKDNHYRLVEFRATNNVECTYDGLIIEAISIYTSTVLLLSIHVSGHLCMQFKIEFVKILRGHPVMRNHIYFKLAAFTLVNITFYNSLLKIVQHFI